MARDELKLYTRTQQPNRDYRADCRHYVYN